jgi:mannose-6-phosphate isomerase-like protein (cupin superfamily)
VDDSGTEQRAAALAAAHAFDIDAVKTRLTDGNGGYEVIHQSAGLELGVYVLVAPEPDRQQPHADDEVYVVLEGSGTLDVEGTQVALHEGHAVFVPAGAEHRFSGYERLSLLVLFEKR